MSLSLTQKVLELLESNPGVVMTYLQVQQATGSTLQETIWELEALASEGKIQWVPGSPFEADEDSSRTDQDSRSAQTFAPLAPGHFLVKGFWFRPNSTR